jgi:FMN reductase
MKNVAIIATSLNPKSKSQILAGKLETYLKDQGVSVETVDLRKHDLPLAGSPGCWEHPDLEHINGVIGRATHIVFAVPVYCYDVNAAAKNVIELMGRSFTEKVVGFICSAGGPGSYMSVMGMANHLMLDFRSVIVPRFFYTSGADWTEEGELNAELEDRIGMLYEDLKRISVVPSA